jgi:hypothetical protein
MAPTIELTAFDIPNMMSEIVLLPVVQCLAQRSPVAVLISEDIWKVRFMEEDIPHRMLEMEVV